MIARRFLLPALVALLLLATLALPGCGQTGDLYFDEAPPEDQLPPSLRRSGSALPAPAMDRKAAEDPAKEEKAREEKKAAK